MLKKVIGFFLLTSVFTVANAHVCLPGYHYSEDYTFELTCNWDRGIDFIKLKTTDLSCDKGLFFYYYCKKD